MFDFLSFFSKSIHESVSIQRQELNNTPIAAKCLSGADCDYLTNGKGSFGKIPNNPIPVNGLIGTFKYLNKLRVNNAPLYFHRLGSLYSQASSDYVDVYELVSRDGQFWDLLYFDVYHPRRSNKKPDNYQLVSYKENPLGDIEFGFGCNVYCLDFPHSLPDSLQHDMNLPTFAKIARENMSKVTYIKPEEHLTKLSEVENKLQGRKCSVLNNSIEEGLVKSIKWYVVADLFTNNRYLLNSDKFSCKITDLELAMMLIRAKLVGWVGGKNLFSISQQEGVVLPIKEGLFLKSSSAMIFFEKLVEYYEQEEEEMSSSAVELIELAFDGDVYVSSIN